MRKESKPITSFNIFVEVPINIPLSGTEENKEILKKICEKRKIPQTQYLRELYLKGLRENGITGFKDLFKLSRSYNSVNMSVKQSLADFLGEYNISKYFDEKLKEDWSNEKGL